MRSSATIKERHVIVDFDMVSEIITFGEKRKNGFMVIFYRETDEELLDLTGENKNDNTR